MQSNAHVAHTINNSMTKLVSCATEMLKKIFKEDLQHEHRGIVIKDHWECAICHKKFGG